jgi:predicted TIM-barrel fold metal-dependent hydrolase
MQMKKVLILVGIVLAIAACKTSNERTTAPVEPKSEFVDLNEFMEFATDSLDKEVKIKGTVSHVCSHSGRRCFIVDTSGTISVRIEAKGEIGAFNRELSGMDIQITGIVREKRLYADYLDEWEIEVKEKEKDEEIDEEQCSAELQNIEDMRNWMVENNKDYYQVIYVDGLDYKVMNEETEQEL